MGQRGFTSSRGGVVGADLWDRGRRPRQQAGSGAQVCVHLPAAGWTAAAAHKSIQGADSPFFFAICLLSSLEIPISGNACRIVFELQCGQRVGLATAPTLWISGARTPPQNQVVIGGQGQRRRNALGWRPLQMCLTQAHAPKIPRRTPPGRSWKVAPPPRQPQVGAGRGGVGTAVWGSK